MEDIVAQFQDLTEGHGIYAPHPNTADNVRNIQTEFAFAISSPTQSGAYLEKYGFAHLSSMNNWWPSHAGQSRELKFYWRKDPKAPNLDKKPQRMNWGRDYYDSRKEGKLSKQLALSGCGFKLATGPVTIKEHYRFFTLMRLPIEPTKTQKALLEKLHYRHIDTGRLASYWINGWKPEEFSFDKEYKFFGISSAIWAQRGDEWYTYEASQHQR